MPNFRLIKVLIFRRSVTVTFVTRLGANSIVFVRRLINEAREKLLFASCSYECCRY